LLHISSQKKYGVWFALAFNDQQKLVACAFSEESRVKAERAVAEAVPSAERRFGVVNSVPAARFKEVYNLFEGRGKVNPNSLDLSRVTSFRKKVYLQLCRIPRGRVTTYGAIAKKLGSRRRARAVGTAVGSNPISLAIPCHRVVPSTLHVGNYGMPGHKPFEGARVKRILLEREGVKFQGTRIAKKSLWFPN
jgi:O-6-methylguanine DNA methyltransferase